MGLLDDAIREHLDLKRRRGADPAEIEQAERDALGPVRRGPEGADDGELDELSADDERFAYDQEDEQDWDESANGEPMIAEDYEPAFEDEPEEPRGSSREPFDAGDDPLDSSTVAHQASEPYPAPEGPARAAPGDSDSHADEDASSSHGRADAQSDSPSEGDTAEFDMAIEDEELGVAGDDVLEETPEFLQDTPDHDRLWFEQRPPKDFDFDG
jgi:hypothetical protein